MTTPIRSAAAFKPKMTMLPSGLEVQIRRPDPQRIIMANKDQLPTALVQQVLAQLNGKMLPKPDVSADDAERWMNYSDMMVKAALVWPQVVDSNPDYEAGQILLDDLPPEDRAQIYMIIHSREVREQIAAAAAFRQQQAEPVPAGSDGAALRPEAE